VCKASCTRALFMDALLCNSCCTRCSCSDCRTVLWWLMRLGGVARRGPAADLLSTSADRHARLAEGAPCTKRLHVYHSMLCLHHMAEPSVVVLE
jgi:hypothetical protein